MVRDCGGGGGGGGGGWGGGGGGKEKEKRADIIIDEGSVSSQGKKGDGGGRRGRRMVGLTMEQERWVRVSRRGSDVEVGGAGVESQDGEEGDDDEITYMTRSGRRDGEMETRREDRGELLVVRREKVEKNRHRQMEGRGSGNERGGRGNGNRGGGWGSGGQTRARGRFEMSGAL